MTPLEFASSILKTLEGVASSALPDTRITAATGVPAVIACAEVRVALGDVTLSTNPQNAWACDVTQIATYLVSISRECARTYDETTGADDYASLAAVSALVDADVDTLTRLFVAIGMGVPSDSTPDPLSPPEATGWGDQRSGAISTLLTGDLVITTLTLVVGVP